MATIGTAAIRAARFDRTEDDAALCRTLMREYAAYLNASVGGEHICVDGLEAELAALPGAYAEPDGTILLGFLNGEAAGCVALKPLHLTPAGSQPSPSTDRACEMKRLWVCPGHQGAGLGRALAEAVIAAARERGYTAMYLDTMPETMQAAYALYLAMGFEPVDRYTHNPVLRQTDSVPIAFLRKRLG